MDSGTPLPPAAPVAAPAAPAPPVSYGGQPPMPAAPAGGSFDNGGGVPTGMPGVKKPGFFSGVTALDIGVLGLVTFALLYNIYYIRQKIYYLRYSQQDTQAAAAA